MGLAASARCTLNCFDAAVPCSPPASRDSQSPHAASAAQNAMLFARQWARGCLLRAARTPAHQVQQRVPACHGQRLLRQRAQRRRPHRGGEPSSPPPLTVQQADAAGAHRPAPAAQRVPLRRPPAIMTRHHGHGLRSISARRRPARCHTPANPRSNGARLPNLAPGTA